MSVSHRKKGSPTYPVGQLQMGLWFSTTQLALMPQEPGQGSWQRCPMQARLGLQ